MRQTKNFETSFMKQNINAVLVNTPPARAPPSSILKIQGKTTVLPVLSLMAPLNLLWEEFWNTFYSYRNVGLMNAHKRWDVKVIRRLKHGIPPNGFKSTLKLHSNSNTSLISWWIFDHLIIRCNKAFHFFKTSTHFSFTAAIHKWKMCQRLKKQRSSKRRIFSIVCHDDNNCVTIMCRNDELS